MSRLALVCGFALCVAACPSLETDLSALSGDFGPPPSGRAMRDLRRSHGARLDHCTVFGAAICVCDDLSMAGSLRVRGGSVAVDGRYVAASGSRIDGDLHAWRGVTIAGSLHVGGSLVTPASVTGSGALYVGGDLDVGESLTGSGDVVVDGTSRVAGASTLAGAFVASATGAYEAPAGAPCGCDDPELLDVDEVVHNAKDTATRLTASDLASGRVLGAGSYYVDAETSLLAFENLRIQGAVSLYVQGDVVSTGEGRIHLDTDATLDLFVTGLVQSAGDLDLGSTGGPDALRLFIGDDGILQIAGSLQVAGLIYAPNATISIAGSAVVRGAIFARNLSYAGSLEVEEYLPDRRICPDLPQDPAGGSGPVVMY